MPDTLICTACSAVSDNLEIYSCPKCWGPVTYQRNSSPCLTSCREGLWHYSDLLPSELDPLPGFPVGDTPLLSAPALAERWAVKEVWIKNETANPTHSFKDRVVAVALARARYLGLKTLACTSTGNLGHALAAACAQSGLRCVVLLPDAVEPAKTAAARALGDRLLNLMIVAQSRGFRYEIELQRGRSD